MDFLIEFTGGALAYSRVTLEVKGPAGVMPGLTAVTGPNGSGKTTLGNVIAKGRHAFNNRMTFARPEMTTAMLAFTDIHSLAGIDAEYAAQRHEATMNDYVPDVASIIGAKARSERWIELTRALGLKDMLTKKINYLSSGELRKLLLVNTLLTEPDILVLDNPYIGLDAAGRREFDLTLQRLIAGGLNVVMLLCDAQDVPEFADAVLPLYNKVVGPVVTDRAAIEAMRRPAPEPQLPPLPPLRHSAAPEAEIAFAITSGTVRYGERVIFSGLDWTVRQGECWALSGRNGSGKSMLLSLVCADNPQGYSNDIVLFDRRRGTGESIWDIKDRIGYVSPEMQLYFRSTVPVVDIVVQGMRPFLGRYRAVTEAERTEALQWLTLLGIAPLAGRRFGELSTGEQRLVLVARVLARQPDLMVLDEPFHGLDAEHKALLRRIIDAMVSRSGAALIFVTHYEDEVPKCVTHFKKLS